MGGLLAALLLTSCSNQTYTIDGKVEDSSLEGTKVYKIDRFDTAALLDGTVKQEDYMDSTVVAGGKFHFEGKTASPDYCTLYIPSGDMQKGPFLYATVVIEPGAKLNVEAKADRKSVVTGSSSNDVLQQYEEARDALSDQFMDIYNRLQSSLLSPEDEVELNGQIDKLREEMYDLDFNFVKENINNPGAWAKLYNAAVMASTLEKQKELISGAAGRTLEIEDYKTVAERIATLEKTAEGQPFTDFEMDDPDGNKVKLSDWAGKGKYVLVDFWASWCGPCKAEMPNVVKCYHQYKDKGFDIVSVSLDTKKENWVKAIDEWGMPWHHMSDLKGWQCEGADIYAVTGVPHAMLLGPDGTILARGLYGESLYAKLAEVMP
ncbi:MAG: AhpC/TSA family protein [Bacteroidales bacterium]|nr:AhpC/TSA family protein [Bacteroidales bacterium]